MFIIISSLGRELIERLINIEHSQETFDKAKEAGVNGFKGMSKVEMAVQYYVLISMSFNSLRKHYRKTGVDKEAYIRDIKYQLPLVYERMEKVEVSNRDGIEFVSEIADRKEAFAFLDVPYVHSLRKDSNAYACELSDEQQIKLLETIKGIKDLKIMLCGYRNQEGGDLYDKYLLPCGWQHYKVCKLVKAGSTAKKKPVADEWIWVNYKLPDGASYIMEISKEN